MASLSSTRLSYEANVPLDVASKLGPKDMCHFGGVVHIGGWLDYLGHVPDTLCITRCDTSGRLAATKEQDRHKTGQFQWSLKSFRNSKECVKFLRNVPMSIDINVLNEANLFISSIQYAFRMSICSHNNILNVNLDLKTMILISTKLKLAMSMMNQMMPVWMMKIWNRSQEMLLPI